MNKNYTKSVFIVLLVLYQYFTCLSQTLNVGIIGGTIDVTKMGAAIYSIPIITIPGTSGVEPALSVVYSSQSGHGIIGEKWHLSGLSCISREGQNIYHDENLTGVNLDNDDRYNLDGMRLVNLGNGAYSTNWANYGTEIKSDVIVTLHDTAGITSQYFTVVTEDGSEIEYGKTFDSKCQSGNKVLSWMINKITDTEGNYMTFTYDFYVGEIFVRTIEYTGNTKAGLSPYAKVSFNYITDTINDNIMYVGNVQAFQKKMLSEISVKYGNTLVRKYLFTYRHVPSTQLKAVILEDANSTELSRTQIEWGEDPEDEFSFETFSSYCLQRSVELGDFNGDNLCDILLLNENKPNMTCNWSIKTNNGTGGFNDYCNGTRISSYKGCTPADVDGDGIDEIVYYIGTGVTTTFRYYDIISPSLPLSNQYITGINNFKSFRVGDFNGDGKADLMFINQDNVASFWGFQASSFTLASDKVHIADITGNGEVNIQVLYGGFCDLYEYDNVNNTFVKIVDEYAFPNDYHYPFYGDFNGDGKKDILFKPKNQNIWLMSMSKGTTYTPHDTIPLDASPLSSNNRYPKYPVMICDVNGDGKDDIIQPVFHWDSPQYLTVHVYYSKGFSDNKYKYDTASFVHDGIFHFNTETSSFYRFGEFNGDGKTDMLYVGAIFHLPILVSFNKNGKSGYVSNITNGMGYEIKIDYAFLSSPIMSYFNEYANKVYYPLVRQLQSSDGLGGYTTKSFVYGSAKFDADRRSLIGFSNLLTYSNSDNVTIQTLSQFNENYRHLMPEQVLYYLGEDPYLTISKTYTNDSTFWTNSRNTTSFYKKILNTIAYKGFSKKRFIPYNSISSYIDNLKNNQILTNITLNTEGRIRSSTQTLKHATQENSNLWVTRQSNDYSYTEIITPNKKRVTKLSSIVSTDNIYNSSQSISHTTIYSYNSGRLSTVTNTDSDGTYTSINYSNYNSLGIPLSKVYYPSNMAPRYEYFTYDNTGRFLLTSTNPLNHVSSYTYNPKTGSVLTSTDVNGLITTYEYDVWGRNISVLYPDQTKDSVSYHLYSNQYMPHAVCYIQNTSSTGPYTRTYKDVLGREIHNYVQGTGYTDICYNGKGQVYRTSMPYTSISTNVSSKTWNTYTYDNYGRITNETAPYKNTSYSYTAIFYNSSPDYIETTTDNLRGVSYTKKYDGAGRVVQATDNGGTINYDYSFQRISDTTRNKTTITACGKTTTIISDANGNRLSITDPDAGTVTSKYDNLQQLIRQTDAKNNITSYTYDLLGRPTQEIRSGNNNTSTVTYIYDNAVGKGIGKIYQTKLNNSVDATYKYDNLGRVIEKTQYVDGASFLYQYSYNNFGQLQYLTYPTSYCIKHIYNNYGELEEIRDNSDNSLIYATDTRNKYRQPLKCRYGNNTATLYTYNSYGMLTGIRNGYMESSVNALGADPVGSAPPAYIVGSQYRNLTYTYDNKGRITGRQDSKVNQYETYTYDNMDRLTSFGINGNTTVSMQYNGMGNIISNSQVGTYSYDNAKPHAVSEIEGATGCPISSMPCEVTYNNRNRPTTISEGGWNVSLGYGVSDTRNLMYLRQGNASKKVKAYPSHNHEHEIRPSGGHRYLDYIYSDNGIVAIHVKRSSSDSLYYVFTDHLGSYNIIIDEDKNIVQQSHFDPWGNRKLNTNWSTADATLDFAFDRGFTGHEHYDRFRIINMKARLYDPVTGRFFSPDPFVQMPDNTQNYNRYSYCLNNPVMYMDPEGEIAWFVPVIIGAVVGAYVGGIQADMRGQNYWDGVWKGAVIGTIGSVLGGIGGAGMTFAENVIWGISEGAVTGAINAALWNEDLGQGALWGAAAGAVFTTLTSSNMTNLFKSGKFLNNENMFDHLMNNPDMTRQDILDYFGFEGTYNPYITSKNYQASDYWGATNYETGQISYGDLAFDNYATLKGTYLKKSFHANKILNHIPLEKLPNDLQGLGMDSFLEEIDGYCYVYKQQGLFNKHNIPLNGIQYYQSNLNMNGMLYPTYPKRFSWIYKIARRW